ncbi:MAG: hypothetical protein KAJ19_19040 [Gammaproteobacteria bacterium]|nr:hypothetical protein [Gammaproteobacteria bacterium]
MLKSTTIYGRYQKNGLVEEMRVYVSRSFHGDEQVLTYTIDGTPPIHGALVFQVSDDVRILCNELRAHIAQQMGIETYDVAFTSLGLM